MARVLARVGVGVAAIFANLLWFVPVPIGLDFLGGSEVRLRGEAAAPDVARTICDQLEDALGADGGSVRCDPLQGADSNEFRVSITPYVGGAAARVAAALGTHAHVEFLPVVPNSPWNDKIAPDRAALAAELAALGPLPDGTRLVYEARTNGLASLLVRREGVFAPTRVAAARVDLTPAGWPFVAVDLDPEGTRLFEAFTAAHIRDRIAVVLGDRVVMAPRIESAIPGGKLHVTLGRAGPPAQQRHEADEIARILKAGRLPALTVETSRDVTPGMPSALGLPLARALALAGALLAALFLWRRSVPTLALATAVLGAALTTAAGTLIAGAALTFAADVAMPITALPPSILAGLLLARKNGPPARLGARLLRVVPAIAASLVLALGAAIALALGAYALAHATAVYVFFGAPLVALLVLTATALVRPAPVASLAATDSIG